ERSKQRLASSCPKVFKPVNSCSSTGISIESCRVARSRPRSPASSTTAGNSLEPRTIAVSLLDSLRGIFSGGRQTLKKIDVESRFARSRTAATGTMSNFFVAYDIERKEDVGVKILDPEKFELFESRFQGLGKPIEGEIAMQMKHDLIVKTYEHGVTNKGERI